MAESAHMAESGEKSPCERNEMDAVLSELAYSSEVVEKFKQEKIGVSIVPLLTDQELSELGIKTVGDRAMLRKHCRESVQSKKVTSEVRRIMGSSTPRMSYSTPSHSLVQLSGSMQIPRKPKRKAKAAIAAEKYGGKKKGRVSTATFQKKVVVFEYMGPDAPKVFTRTDKKICTRGLLPPILVDSSEDEVRNEICDVVRTCSIPDLSECTPNDFEFIDMSGKQARVPQCKIGFEWDGRAVKELAGTGCVYIRLTRNIVPESETSSGDDLPPAFTLASHQPSSSHSSFSSDSTRWRVSTGVDSSDPSTSRNVDSSGPNTSRHIDSSGPSTSRNADSSGPSTSRDVASGMSPRVVFIDDDDNDLPPLCKHGASDPVEDITKLVEMFPNMDESQLKYLYDLSKCSFTRTVDCALEGPSLESLRGLAVTQVTIPPEESPRIRLDADDDDLDWVEAALAFYKQSKFIKEAQVRVSIRGQQGIDTGGVRRQFFSVVFSKLAQPSSSSFTFFEGSTNRLRPAFKASTLSSGMLTTIGTMVAHSILLDGQGFPFIADFCYYYIAGCYDRAITCITVEDVSIGVKNLLSEFETIESDAELLLYGHREELMEVMEKCGCDLPLSIRNKKSIVECIILYDALHKRRIYLDAFASGLEVFGLKTLISHFPEILKPLFVSTGEIKPVEVIELLKPRPSVSSMDEYQRRVWGYLLAFIDRASGADLKAFIQFVTGSPVAVGRVSVTFDDSMDSQAISANTCGRQLVLSSHIDNKEMFISAMAAIVPEVSFTMP